MEQFIESLAALNPIWIYFFAAAIAYIENIFPPLPSDVILIAIGSIAGFSRIDFTLLLMVSTLGSVMGFLTMYNIGEWFGVRILKAGKIKFISPDKIHIVETWFKTYGYWVVIANRFLAGTRAVISFFTGMSELPIWKTSALAALSSLLWNSILLLAGRELGKSWKEISSYLESYGKIIALLIAIVALILIAKRVYKRYVREGTEKKF